MLNTNAIQSIPTLLNRGRDAHGARVVFEDADRTVTWRALDDRTRSLGGALRGLSADRGDRILLYLRNSIALVEAYLGVIRAGCTAACINVQSTPDHVVYVLEDTAPAAVITDAMNLEKVREALSRADVPRPTLIVDGADISGSADHHSFEALLTEDAATSPSDNLGMDEPAWILYTSGATGRPKGVLLTQHSMMWIVGASWLPFLDMDVDDVVLCPLPLSHSYPLNMMLAVMAAGARAFIMERFSVAETLRWLRDRPVTILLGVPTTFAYLRTQIPSTLTNSKLRLSISAGAVLAEPLAREVEDRLGAPLIDAYGATESSTVITMNSHRDGGRVRGSCGVPALGLSVRIVDPNTGKDVPCGAEGELIVRGPSIMKGYLNQPEETSKTLRDGWYWSGDLAKTDRNGYFFITGRVKDIIIRGGENIAPAEIEAVVLDYPDVVDCAVVGVPHESLGEVPVVFYVSREGASVTPDAVIGYCQNSLPPFKVPAQARAIEAIPKTASGKIIRHKLAEVVAGSE